MKTEGNLVSEGKWGILLEKVKEKTEDIPEHSEAKQRENKEATYRKYKQVSLHRSCSMKYHRK